MNGRELDMQDRIAELEARCKALEHERDELRLQCRQAAPAVCEAAVYRLCAHLHYAGYPVGRQLAAEALADALEAMP